MVVLYFINIQSYMDKEETLPSLTLYRRNCQASKQNYLAYLSSTTEITLLQFTKNNKICNSTIIKIPLEPVKAISIKVAAGSVYIAAVFITKFIIFCGSTLVTEQVLKLDANIVSFDNNYVSICDIQDGFAFLSRKGELTLYNISSKLKTTFLPVQPAQTFYSCVAYMPPAFYFGTQTGKIKIIKLEGNGGYKQSFVHDTNSNFPIFHIIPHQNHGEVYFATCEGELYIIGKEGGGFSSISVHRGMVVKMMVNGNALYTVGEDQVVNKFDILGGRQLKLSQSIEQEKLVSLLATVNSKAYISYYQTPILKQV